MMRMRLVLVRRWRSRARREVGIADCGLRTVDCGLRVADWWVLVALGNEDRVVKQACSLAA